MPMSYRLYLQRLGDAYYRGTALLLKKFKPTLNIVDGGIAGQGQGPGSNDAFWWGWLLASEDPVALDITVCRLFGLDWQKLRMSREAAQAGVGIFDADAIDMVGATLQEASVSVRAADTSVHRYPCRVLVGNGATIEGTLGHWKTIADAWLDTNLWLLFTSRGTPTFMFGEVEDSDFEQHIQEGPYVVLGDTCLEKYKYDPRVIYVPGWPVPQSYIQHEMVDRMGFGALYEPGIKMFQTGSSLLGRLRGVSGPKAKRKAWLTTLGMAAAAAGVSWFVARGAKLAGSEAQA
jgi:hypothetical protein